MKILFFLLFYGLSIGSVLSQETSLEECKHTLNRALESNNRDSLAAAYCKIGEYYVYRNSDSARYFFEKGLKHVRKTDADLYAVLLVNEAETYFSKGDIDEAAQRYHFALRELERLKSDETFKVSVLSSLGVIFRRMSMPDSALVYYTRALDILEVIDDPDEKLYLLTNIAILYANTQRMEEASYYIDKAMKLVNRCQDLDMVMYAGSTAGIIYGKLNKCEQGITYLHQVIGKGQKEKKPRFVLKGMTYLLGQFQKMDMGDSVSIYLEKADRVARTLPEANTEVQGFREVQYQMLTYLKRYQESLDIQQFLLDHRVENAQASRADLYYGMAKNYIALKEYAQAVVCYEHAMAYADSLKQKELNQQMSEWTVKYKTQEKEIEIIRLKQERSEQKTRILQWSILVFVLVLILVFVMIYSTIRRKQLKKIEELKMAKSYIEGLERERSRLAKDLHDGVCNDLFGVGMQLSVMQPTEDNKHELIHLLERIRQDVRSISHELMPPQFHQLTLLDTVEAYLYKLPHTEMEKVNFMHEEEVDWKYVSDSVAYEVYRIMQEWLSNVWKHAQTTQVDVLLALYEHQLVLRVINNGNFFEKTGKESSGGIGLSTIQERVKSVGGNISIQFQDGKQFFELSISDYSGNRKE